VCRSLPYVVVVVIALRWRCSTRDPPHEQLLMGLGAGGLSFVGLRWHWRHSTHDPPHEQLLVGCSWGWRWVVCRLLPYVGVGVRWFIGLHWCWRSVLPTIHHEQLLVGLEVGGVLGWCGLSRTGFCR
jgi:hypothetical protein